MASHPRAADTVTLGTVPIGHPGALARRRLGGGGGPVSIGPGPGQGTVVATFTDRAGAEQAVDLLVAQRVGVAGLCIVGEDVRLVPVEVVSRGWAGLTGLAAGGLFGVLLGLAFGFVGLADPITSTGTVAAWGALLGGGAGLGVGLVAAAPGTGTELEAAGYALVAPPERAAAAARGLGRR